MIYVKRARDALVESIEVWQHKKTIDHCFRTFGPDACPLCKRFYPWEFGKDDCGDCPIALRTGQSLCTGSPYGEAEKIHKEGNGSVYGRDDNCPERKAKQNAALDKMIDFMIDVLNEFDARHGHRVIE